MIGKSLIGNNLEAVNMVSNLLRKYLGSNLLEIRVFGSVVRGTATTDSDIDLLILVKEKNSQVRDIVADIVLEVDLAYDVVIAPVIMTEEHYSYPPFQKTLFFKNLEREGVSL